MGFVPWIQFWFNIRRAIIVIAHIKRTKEKNRIVISKDGEKIYEKNSATSCDKNSTNYEHKGISCS